MTSYTYVIRHCNFLNTFHEARDDRQKVTFRHHAGIYISTLERSIGKWSGSWQQESDGNFPYVYKMKSLDVKYFTLPPK